MSLFGAFQVAVAESLLKDLDSSIRVSRVRNPCSSQGKTCSNRGTCVLGGINSAACECETGYSGENCEVSCKGRYRGSYPFGYTTNVPNKVANGCNSISQCYYLSEGQDYPNSRLCTYKKEPQINTCNCGNHPL